MKPLEPLLWSRLPVAEVAAVEKFEKFLDPCLAFVALLLFRSLAEWEILEALSSGLVLVDLGSAGFLIVNEGCKVW